MANQPPSPNDPYEGRNNPLVRYIKYLFLCPLLAYVSTFLITLVYWSVVGERATGSMFPLFLVCLTIVTAYIICQVLMTLLKNMRCPYCGDKLFIRCRSSDEARECIRTHHIADMGTDNKDGES
jgi:DNA-directed RNA polymerase subunit RPC12/RpoP